MRKQAKSAITKPVTLTMFFISIPSFSLFSHQISFLF
jgi:hypothetical protein